MLHEEVTLSANCAVYQYLSKCSGIFVHFLKMGNTGMDLWKQWYWVYYNTSSYLYVQMGQANLFVYSNVMLIRLFSIKKVKHRGRIWGFILAKSSFLLHLWCKCTSDFLNFVLDKLPRMYIVKSLDFVVAEFLWNSWIPLIHNLTSSEK